MCRSAWAWINGPRPRFPAWVTLRPLARAFLKQGFERGGNSIHEIAPSRRFEDQSARPVRSWAADHGSLATPRFSLHARRYQVDFGEVRPVPADIPSQDRHPLHFGVGTDVEVRHRRPPLSSCTSVLDECLSGTVGRAVGKLQAGNQQRLQMQVQVCCQIECEARFRVDQRIDSHGACCPSVAQCPLGPWPPSTVVREDVQQDVGIHKNQLESFSPRVKCMISAVVRPAVAAPRTRRSRWPSRSRRLTAGRIKAAPSDSSTTTSVFGSRPVRSLMRAGMVTCPFEVIRI